MGLGSFFKGLGKAATSFIPGGGIVSGILDGVAGAAPVAGGAAAGARNGRMEQSKLDAEIYKTLMQAELAKGDLDLQRQKFSLEAPGMRAGQVGRAEMINGGVQDLSLGGPGNWNVSGGLRPSAFGPQFKEAAGLMGQGHMDKLRSGESFEEIKFPEAPKMEKAGFMEKALGGVALGGSFIDAIMRGVGKKATGATPPFVPNDYVSDAVRGANPDLSRVVSGIKF
jgi:hypothetical protein